MSNNGTVGDEHKLIMRETESVSDSQEHWPFLSHLRNESAQLEGDESNAREMSVPK
jgi:hypothetical protein